MIQIEQIYPRMKLSSLVGNEGNFSDTVCAEYLDY